MTAEEACLTARTCRDERRNLHTLKALCVSDHEWAYRDFDKVKVSFTAPVFSPPQPFKHQFLDLTNFLAKVAEPA